MKVSNEYVNFRDRWTKKFQKPVALSKSSKQVIIGLDRKTCINFVYLHFRNREFYAFFLKPPYSCHPIKDTAVQRTLFLRTDETTVKLS